MPKLKEIIGEQAYNALPEETRKQYADTINLVDDAEYVPKKDYDTAQTTIKQKEKDILKRDKDIEAIQAQVKDNETLSREIDDLKEANKKEKENFESELAKASFDRALEKKLGDYKPKNISILKNSLDDSRIKLDGENFLGLEEQITKLKETDPYLFAEESKGGTGTLGGGGSSSSILDDKNTDTGNLSIGARLAKQRSEASKVTEAQQKFFG
jgi:glycerol-3-phosphate cytidylyltransferase-like family protein